MAGEFQSRSGIGNPTGAYAPDPYYLAYMRAGTLSALTMDGWPLSLDFAKSGAYFSNKKAVESFSTD